jgi:CBS domain-containing protein
MIADDIMTRQPITVSEETSIGDALAVLSEERIRHLPVVRGGDVVGILSDRDFRSLGVSLMSDEHALERLRAQLARPVSVLMSGGVVTVGRDADAVEIAEVMLEEKLSAVPVVEPGTQVLAGIVSYLDLLRAALPLLEQDE